MLMGPTPRVSPKRWRPIIVISNSSYSYTEAAGHFEHLSFTIYTKEWNCFKINVFYLFIFLTSYPFYTYQCTYVNPNRPIHPTTTPPPPLSPLESIRLFSTAVSQFLPCKPVHLYHFSRFHIHVLMYDICFSLSDLLHSV